MTLNLNPNSNWSLAAPSTVNVDADALPPSDYGLPADKFPDWRPNQLELIHRILNSNKRVIVACASTGFGKTLAIAGAALMSGQRSVVLTMTRGLQDQYAESLNSVTSDIRGLSNYLCPIAAQLGVPATTTVADAPCQCGYRCRLKLSGECGYYGAYRKAQRADITVTNYSCWMYDGLTASEEKGSLQFGLDPERDRKVGILFADEAHDAAEAVSMFVGVDLSRRECLQSHIQWPDSGWGVEQWQLWAVEQLEGVSERVKDQESRLRNSGNSGNSRGWSKELKHLRDLKRKLDRLSAMRAEDEWIVSENAGDGGMSGMSGVRFDPLSPARYAESALFRGIEKVVLVSATVRPKTAAMLGIEQSDMEFVEYPSTFPVERRPVIHIPSIRVTYHTEQNDVLMQEWLAVIDGIIGPRVELGRKGLIHAVSYARAKFLRDNSRYGYLMMIHSTWDRARVVEEFRLADGPRLLVSPSVDTGYDFAGDAARFQILCKIPFASVRDPLVKARQSKDRDYDLYSVAQTIVQSCGRTTRSEQDWSESFIVDDSLAWCLPKMKAKGFIPKYWMDSFRSVDRIPEPIQFDAGEGKRERERERKEFCL